jgi:hypothetical protein
VAEMILGFSMQFTFKSTQTSAQIIGLFDDDDIAPVKAQVFALRRLHFDGK